MKKTELKKNIDILGSYIQYLRENYNVKRIGVFGSAVRGQQKRHSDVDILVELSAPIGFFKFIELEYFLGRVLKRRVDLVTKKALKPAIKQDILKDVVYA